MTKTKAQRDQAIIEKWDAMTAAPENKYLKATPKAFKISADLDVSYATVIKVLIAAGRYQKR